MNEQKVNTAIRLPLQTRERLEQRARKNERTLSQELRLAIRHWLSIHESLGSDAPELVATDLSGLADTRVG